MDEKATQLIIQFSPLTKIEPNTQNEILRKLNIFMIVSEIYLPTVKEWWLIKVSLS